MHPELIPSDRRSQFSQVRDDFLQVLQINPSILFGHWFVKLDETLPGVSRDRVLPTGKGNWVQLPTEALGVPNRPRGRSDLVQSVGRERALPVFAKLHRCRR